MRLFGLVALLLLAATVFAGCSGDDEGNYRGSATAEAREKFDGTLLGAIPAGWKVVTGSWGTTVQLSAPSGPNVMKQTATVVDTFPVLINNGAGTFGNFEAYVKFDILNGTAAQAGGLAFRFVDKDNYYAVRYNNNEGTWNIFRWMGGQREKFDGVAGAPSAGLNQWIELKVEAEGTHIQAWANNVKVIDYTEGNGGAPKLGKIGLWTKDDSIVSFDDFEAEPKTD
ncbi:MAG: family 16 glycoside hydrolase [bacterium]